VAFRVRLAEKKKKKPGAAHARQRFLLDVEQQRNELLPVLRGWISSAPANEATRSR